MRINDYAVKNNVFTRSEAADMIGRSLVTLKRWHRSGMLIPSHKATFGKTECYFYTDADLKKGRDIASTLRRGPKPAQEAA